MSTQNKGTAKKKRTQQEKSKMVVRIICIVLAVLMVLGVAYYTIMLIASAVSAASDSLENEIPDEMIDASSLKSGEDVLVAVGLMYGSNLTTGFEISTPVGYEFGYTDLLGDRKFHRLWTTRETVLSATSDDNLSKTGMTYLITSSRYETVIGGYHVELNGRYLDEDDLADLIDETGYALAQLGLSAIPSYINGRYTLRIGDFATWDSAFNYVDTLEWIFPDYGLNIAGPSSTAVSVLNPYTDEIVFEFDGSGTTELGIQALEDRTGNTYITTPAGNYYDGVFCFKRYDNGETDGVSLINIVPLEAYIAGVVPYENSNSWPLETLRAFAITVRSFTLTHLNKHAAYGFDLCNTTDCQVYKGAGRINERVMEVVGGTRGKVMTYEGDIVPAYYSSSAGGVTVSAQDAWGSTLDTPYLQAVETPWEDYMNHANGFWINEVSPEALCERLNKAGYDELEDAIRDVTITELAKNSTYVKKLTVTDIHGNSVTIVNTDKVRVSLSPYVKSANFVVGRGSVEYTENVVITQKPDEAGEPGGSGGEEDGWTVSSGDEEEYDKAYGYIDVSDIYVETDTLSSERNGSATIGIYTANELIDYKKIDVFVVTSDNAAAYLGDDYVEQYASSTSYLDYDDQYKTEVLDDKSTAEVLYKVAYAENKDNFIFVGKGWGHGVGISQYGSFDLAQAGYKAEEILRAYFKGIDIIPYRQSNNFRKDD